MRGIRSGEAALPSEVRIAAVPTTYRIVYEVRSAAGPEGGETVTTEVLQVERPFRSLVVHRAGPPPGSTITSGRITDLNRLLLFTTGGWSELQIPPAMAGSDARLDSVLDDLVAAGDVERLDEVRRVAGRACQVHRLGGPIGGGSLLPVDAGSGEHADVCVDAAGLVLEERWTKDGTVLRHRVAVDVAVGIDFDPGTFAVEDPDVLDATAGGGSARRVSDDARFGDRTWELPAPPPGFERLGRWAVVWPKLETTTDPFAAPTAGRVAGLATVWAAGPDALVVEQGGVADGGRAFAPHPLGTSVELGALDLGEVITDARGTEVRVSYVDGSYVRVWSTLPRAEVIELARSLVAGPGGEPEYEDP